MKEGARYAGARENRHARREAKSGAHFARPSIPAETEGLLATWNSGCRVLFCFVFSFSVLENAIEHLQISK